MDACGSAQVPSVWVERSPSERCARARAPASREVTVWRRGLRGGGYSGTGSRGQALQPSDGVLGRRRGHGHALRACHVPETAVCRPRTAASEGPAHAWVSGCGLQRSGLRAGHSWAGRVASGLWRVRVGEQGRWGWCRPSADTQEGHMLTKGPPGVRRGARAPSSPSPCSWSRSGRGVRPADRWLQGHGQAGSDGIRIFVQLLSRVQEKQGLKVADGGRRGPPRAGGGSRRPRDPQIWVICGWGSGGPAAGVEPSPRARSAAAQRLPPADVLQREEVTPACPRAPSPPTPRP